jgi:hypothetical protein
MRNNPNTPDDFDRLAEAIADARRLFRDRRPRR